MTYTVTSVAQNNNINYSRRRLLRCGIVSAACVNDGFQFSRGRVRVDGDRRRRMSRGRKYK